MAFAHVDDSSGTDTTANSSTSSAKMMRDSKAESAHTGEVLEPSGERPQQREQGHGKRSTTKQSRSEETQAAKEGSARFGSAQRESDQGSTASVRNGEEALRLAGPHKNDIRAARSARTSRRSTEAPACIVCVLRVGRLCQFSGSLSPRSPETRASSGLRTGRLRDRVPPLLPSCAACA